MQKRLFMDCNQRVEYTNYKGVTAVRTIRPLHIWHGSTEYHPEPQWLLRAMDVEKGEERDFALKDMSPAWGK